MTTLGAGGGSARRTTATTYTQKLVHMDGGVSGSANSVGTGVTVLAASAVAADTTTTISVDRCPSYIASGMNVYDASKDDANSQIGTVSSCTGTTLTLSGSAGSNPQHAISANDVLWIAQPLSPTDTCNAVISYTVRGTYESTAATGGAWMSYEGLATYPTQGLMGTDVMWQPGLSGSESSGGMDITADTQWRWNISNIAHGTYTGIIEWGATAANFYSLWRPSQPNQVLIASDYCGGGTGQTGVYINGSQLSGSLNSGTGATGGGTFSWSAPYGWTLGLQQGGDQANWGDFGDVMVWTSPQYTTTHANILCTGSGTGGFTDGTGRSRCAAPQSGDGHGCGGSACAAGQIPDLDVANFFNRTTGLPVNPQTAINAYGATYGDATHGLPTILLQGPASSFASATNANLGSGAAIVATYPYGPGVAASTYSASDGPGIHDTLASGSLWSSTNHSALPSGKAGVKWITAFPHVGATYLNNVTTWNTNQIGNEILSGEMIIAAWELTFPYSLPSSNPTCAAPGISLTGAAISTAASNNLTFSSAGAGTVAIGQNVTGTGVPAGEVITAGSGTTWTVSPQLGTAIGSETMTAGAGTGTWTQVPTPAYDSTSTNLTCIYYEIAGSGDTGMYGINVGYSAASSAQSWLIADVASGGATHTVAIDGAPSSAASGPTHGTSFPAQQSVAVTANDDLIGIFGAQRVGYGYFACPSGMNEVFDMAKGFGANSGPNVAEIALCEESVASSGSSGALTMSSYSTTYGLFTLLSAKPR
ncbi:MAG TPA: hypothetical protein VEH77_14110 [Roseiarcus sp.]|nr:hypothetical protein [Roseiarcus sp.]